MHRRQASGVAEFFLSEREPKTIVFHQAYMRQSQVHFANQVRDALEGIAATKVHDPGARGNLPPLRLFPAGLTQSRCTKVDFRQTEKLPSAIIATAR